MIRFLWRTSLKHAIPFFITICLAACEPLALWDGHKLYNDGKYEEAFNKYNEGLAKNPGSHTLNYHAGIALYKKGDYVKAVEFFTKVLTTEDSDLEARASYNIGNCKYRQGEQRENTDLERTADLYQEALDYYQRASELNEKDEEAKYNHDFVKKKLDDILSKLQKQTAETKKDTGKERKDEGRPLTRETFPSPTPPAIKGPEHLGRVQQGQPQKGGRKTNQQLGEGRQTKGEIIEMSKEEAEMMLEAYRQEEELRVELKDRKKREFDSKIRKDW